MSRRYTADGKRKSSRTHARYTWTCMCGRVLNGNGGISSHKRACTAWMEYWLPRLEKLLEDPMITETRWRLAQERDEIRRRLGTAASQDQGGRHD
jgi:hypothetical protein